MRWKDWGSYEKRRKLLPLPQTGYGMTEFEVGRGGEGIFKRAFGKNKLTAFSASSCLWGEGQGTEERK